MNEADIIYRTADGKRICITVTIAIKELLRLSERQMRSQRRQDRRRHTEYIDGLTDTTMIFPQEDFADLVLRMDRYKQLYSSIDELPKTQRRRLQLYYFAGMSQQEIGDMEGVSQRAVGYSLAGAIRKLKKVL